jgi:uncharacterized protein
MMKRLLIPIFLFLSIFAGAQIEKAIPEAPNPPKLVVDLTGTLTADQMSALEAKLVAYDDSTSNQVAVIIIPTTGDYDIAEYSFALGRKWGIGNKEFNNGVVFLIAKNDRKVFIAPGYGLEGAIPDIIAKQIIENIVVPNFKGNDFYGGINAGTDALIQAAQGEYKAPAGYGNRGQKKRVPLMAVIIVVIIIWIIISKISGGGGGGSFMSRRGYRNFRGPSVWWFPTGGGGGGGFGGGGGGGGGFGGFGGGSFGGGGAGGSW